MRTSETADADAQDEGIDLGGGFVLVDDPAHGPLIEATALADTGALGFASPASVDARLDADALAWVSRAGLAPRRTLCALDQVHSATCAATGDGQTVTIAPAYCAACGAPLDPGATRCPYCSAPVENVALARLSGVDAVWTSSPDDLLIVRTADCAAVWLVDPEHERLAMVHAGWRGAADGIIRHTVDTLREQGAHPDFIIAAIGPHIGPCCFEIGPEVAGRFSAIDAAVGPASLLTAPRKRDDSASLNLGAVLVAQLCDAGLPAAAINLSTACTRCFRLPDGTFALHSYRRNGAGGPLAGSIGFLER